MSMSHLGEAHVPAAKAPSGWRSGEDRAEIARRSHLGEAHAGGKGAEQVGADGGGDVAGDGERREHQKEVRLVTRLPH